MTEEKYNDAICELFSIMEKEKIPCKESYLKGYIQAIKHYNKDIENRINFLESNING